MVAEADSGAGAVAAIAEHRPDLVLLDVQMPGMDGLDVTRALSAAHTPRIVFVTAHEEYAMRRSRCTCSTTLKPVSRERFRRCPSPRARAARAGGQRAVGADARPVRRVAARAQLRRSPARPRGGSGALRAHSGYRLGGSRSQLPGPALPRGDAHASRHAGCPREDARPKDFVRINRSSVVRLDAIRELQPWFHGEHKVIVQDDTELRWSRRYAGAARGPPEALLTPVSPCFRPARPGCCPVPSGHDRVVP